MNANLFEQPRKIKNKITSRGLENPRVIKARRQEREEERYCEELAHTFRVLSKREIKAQYPPEYVEDLLRRANLNLANMRAPKLRPYWVPEE